MLSRLSFRQKMLVPSVVMAVAALVAAGLAFAISRRASEELNRVERVHAPALELARDLEDVLSLVERQFQDAATAEDPALLTPADGLRTRLLLRLDEAVAAGLASSLDEATRSNFEAYFQLGRTTASRLIAREQGEALAGDQEALSERLADLRNTLALRTSRARAAMAEGLESARVLQERSVTLGAGILVLAALGAAGLTWWLVAGAVRPLEALHRAALLMAEGDLTVPIEVTGRDELGALAGSFSAMAGRLREVIAALRSASADLSGAAVDLEQLTRAQTELLERQASGVAQTSTATRDLEQTSSVAASRASAVLDVARRGAAFSEQGLVSAQESVAGIQQIQDSVEQVVAQSTRLLDQGKTVGEIVETVKDLATRSHVLSLNASIEAVRAGEAGKGFAVVASEVRTLAEQSGGSAARIGKLVQEILAAIQATLDLTDRSRRGMEGSLGAVRASGQSLGQIGAIVKETSEAALQIATAVQQQSTGVGQIARAMRDLEAGMEATVSRLQGLERAAAHLRATSTRISEIAGAFRVE